MIDSLLFLSDDVADLTVDVDLAPRLFGSEPDLAHAASDPVAASDPDADEAGAAVEATRAGHAHAAAGAWDEAATALERSAVVRDTLVAAGLAGPVVAARAWADLATVRLAAGDIAGAHVAFGRAHAGLRDVVGLPDALGEAMTELEAALGPVPDVLVATGADDAVTEPAGGLLWLNTAGELPAPATAEVAPPATADGAASDEIPSPPTRIAAIDAAVALAHAGRGPEGSSGLRERLRRLIRR